ncbi:transglycosylase SLT domain-containing protein [Rhizobium sp. MC63]|uniref:Transglycosylase SLT domain-containing protein n=1 Tax=Rhizobium mulingense TaxID=3031128 RepID=A0ACC6N2Z3_9HYPH|nr:MULTISPECIES: transglycosylase SLT domain-containing protein [unclassified Rhizobium]MDF0699499.1 transglycosylase SLT domain-containing protein [Rhizobium sp. MC63]MEA3519817.1 transglycosylase SLT domain-containing protein [Rhizobium sp. MJ31]
MAAFVDIAQSCAPMVEVKTLAGVVSLESRFHPFAIRINSGPPLAAQPTTKAEGIELATSFIADGQDIQLGLGGLGVEELRKLKLSISDAFDPCLNLTATAQLLDGYYRLALREGASAVQAEKVMLQAYYGRGNPSVGAMVRYDVQVRDEAKRLSPGLALLTIGDASRQADPGAHREDQAARPLQTQNSTTAEALPWDVFSAGRRASVLVFQNDRSEPNQ